MGENEKKHKRQEKTTIFCTLKTRDLKTSKSICYL